MHTSDPFVEYVPAGHISQVSPFIFGFVPAGHIEQPPNPLDEYAFVAHVKQLPLPDPAAYFPASQSIHEVVSNEYFPSGQAVHESLPVCSVNVPLSQSLQIEIPFKSIPLLNFPIGQYYLD